MTGRGVMSGWLDLKRAAEYCSLSVRTLRQYIGHPEFGSERVTAEVPTEGPTRGARMPEAFPTFEPFWARG